MLRFITRQIRDQNWVTVAVEFAIVVAGVLLAFQINAWSEAARTRAVETAYLHRLNTEMDVALASIAQAIDDAQAQIADLDQAMALLADGGAFSTADERILRRGLTAADRYRSVSPPRAVLDDLVAIGGLASLGDPEVRQAISAYRTALDRINQRFETYARDAVSLVDVVGVDGPVRRLYRPDAFSRSVLSIEFERLQADAAFQTAFLGQLRVQIVAQDDRRHVLAQAQALKRALEASLDTQQHDTDEP